MFVAAWSFDLQYGTREDALRLMRELKGTMKNEGWKAKHTRVLAGSIGAPESRIVVQHEFASLSDLENSWEGLHKNASVFQGMIKQMKAFIVSGSPRWEIYRVVDEG